MDIKEKNFLFYILFLIFLFVLINLFISGFLSVNKASAQVINGPLSYHQCPNSDYSDMLAWYSHHVQYISLLCFNEGDLNKIDGSVLVPLKSKYESDGIVLKTEISRQLELIASSTNPQIASRICYNYDLDDCNSWKYHDNYYINAVYPTPAYPGVNPTDFAYSTQNIRDPSGNIIYNSDYLQYQPLITDNSFLEWITPVNATTTTSNTFPIYGRLFISSEDIDRIPEGYYKVVAEFQSYQEAPSTNLIQKFDLTDYFDISTGLDQYAYFGSWYTSYTLRDNIGYHLGVLKLEPELYPETYLLDSSILFSVTATSTDLYTPIFSEASGWCDSYAFPVDKLCEVAVKFVMSSVDLKAKFLELSNNMSTRIPFGFFYLIKNKVDDVVDTEELKGSDVVLTFSSGSFINGNVKVVDWEAVKDRISMFGDAFIYFIYVAWILFAFYAFKRLVYLFD